MAYTVWDYDTGGFGGNRPISPEPWRRGRVTLGSRIHIRAVAPTGNGWADTDMVRLYDDATLVVFAGTEASAATAMSSCTLDPAGLNIALTKVAEVDAGTMIGTVWYLPRGSVGPGEREVSGGTGHAIAGTPMGSFQLIRLDGEYNGTILNYRAWALNIFNLHEPSLDSGVFSNSGNSTTHTVTGVRVGHDDYVLSAEIGQRALADGYTKTGYANDRQQRIDGEIFSSVERCAIEIDEIVSFPATTDSASIGTTGWSTAHEFVAFSCVLRPSYGRVRA